MKEGDTVRYSRDNFYETKDDDLDYDYDNDEDHDFDYTHTAREGLVAWPFLDQSS